MKSTTYIESILNGDLDKTLVKLYLEENLDYQKSRYIKSIEKFVELYGDDDIEIYSTPGRTEIGGNHTDHNLGVVVAASVNIDVLAVVSNSDDDTISLYSEGYGHLEPVSILDDSIVESEFETTKSLIKGVCVGIKNRGGKSGAFKAYMTSDVLQGSGLSSSAAFEVSIGTILNHEYNDAKFTAVEIAQIGQYAENVYFNKPSGLMDQTACSVGSLITIDFHDNENPIVTPIEFNLDEYNLALCVINSGGSHADLTSDYAAIKHEMCSVAEYFGKPVLGHVDRNEFISNIANVREKVGDRAVLRAIHFYMECDRANAIREKIENKDIDGFLNKIIEGGHSSFEYNQNAFTLDDSAYQPVSLALCMSQQLLQGKRAAWRLQGGGFAGTIQCFVDKGMLKQFATSIEAVFGKGNCHILSIRNHGSIKITNNI